MKFPGAQCSALRFGCVAAILCVASINAASQSTTSIAVVTEPYVGTLCSYAQGPSSAATKASCSGGFTENDGTVGTGTASAQSSYAGLGIAARATIVENNNQPGNIQAQAIAKLTDYLVVSGLTQDAYVLVASLSSTAPGSTASTSVEEDVTVTANNQSAQCSMFGLGFQSCNTQVPIPAYYGQSVTLNVYYTGTAQVFCGAGCGGGEAYVSAGYRTPGQGARILVIRVVDGAGNPIKGITIASSSGHVYPSKFASTTTLASSPNPSTAGQLVTLTATVTSFGRTSTPTGRVTFKDTTTGTTLGHASLNSTGVATFTTSSLASGTHSIVASYGGDVWSSGGHSSALSQVVN